MSGPKTSQQSLQSIETGMENCETFQARVQHFAAFCNSKKKKTFNHFCFQCLKLIIRNSFVRFATVINLLHGVLRFSWTRIKLTLSCTRNRERHGSFRFKQSQLPMMKALNGVLTWLNWSLWYDLIRISFCLVFYFLIWPWSRSTPLKDEVIFYTLHLHEPKSNENGPATPRSFKVSCH